LNNSNDSNIVKTKCQYKEQSDLVLLFLRMDAQWTGVVKKRWIAGIGRKIYDKFY